MNTNTEWRMSVFVQRLTAYSARLAGRYKALLAKIEAALVSLFPAHDAYADQYETWENCRRSCSAALEYSDRDLVTPTGALIERLDQEDGGVRYRAAYELYCRLVLAPRPSHVYSHDEPSLYNARGRVLPEDYETFAEWRKYMRRQLLGARYAADCRLPLRGALARKERPIWGITDAQIAMVR